MAEIDIIKSLIFYGFSAGILIFALASLFANRIIYSLISAIGVFFAAAGIYFLLGAEYNAVVQIAIYGVAVPILFVFAIMFTSDKIDKGAYLSFGLRFYISFLSIGVLFLALIYLLATSFSLSSHSEWIFQKQTMFINKYQMFKALTDGFFSNYVFAFEVLSILLLVIVVGLSTFNLSKENADE